MVKVIIVSTQVEYKEKVEVEITTLISTQVQVEVPISKDIKSKYSRPMPQKLKN